MLMYHNIRHLFIPVEDSPHLKHLMELINYAVLMVLVYQLSWLQDFLPSTCQLHQHENRSG